MGQRLTEQQVRKLRNSARYRKARRTFLGRNPLCQTCRERGLRVPATDLDHVLPVHTHPELFWDTSNWSAKCKACHKAKTDAENAERWEAGRGPRWNDFQRRLAEMVGEQT